MANSSPPRVNAPISPAYSLISKDFAKLRTIMELLTPGLVFAADGEAYGRAAPDASGGRILAPRRSCSVTAHHR